MKKVVSYIVFFFATAFFWSCEKDGNYPGGTVSPYIAILDLRGIYEGKDVTLTKENMFGSDKIAGVVTSDHRGKNIPAGLLVLQGDRRLGQLRGIVINIGVEAANYVPGDSVIISVEGGQLTRVGGMLQVTGVNSSKISKVASGRPITPLVVKSNQTLTTPSSYESVLVSVEKAGFDPALPTGSTYAGDRLINDGFGSLALHTEAAAAWANKPLPFFLNFIGIVMMAVDGKPQLWPRTEADIIILSTTAPKIASIIITGYLTDPPASSDANNEYIQLMATRDIDFAATPFAVVTTNNAGASTPTGVPVNGWATGGLRTYKINITSGTVAAGQYFYVGANKNIWGAGSTDLSSSKWFGKMYASSAGDGFGNATSNLLANSGNGAGIAVFDKTTVDAETIPVDVIFYGGAGELFSATPQPRGYRITNTDYYDEKNPTTQAAQPYYTQGSNTGKFAFPTVVANVGGYFGRLGGKYNKTTGRWTTARIQTNVLLTATSQVSEIEGGTTIE